MSRFVQEKSEDWIDLLRPVVSALSPLPVLGPLARCRRSLSRIRRAARRRYARIRLYLERTPW